MPDATPTETVEPPSSDTPSPSGSPVGLVREAEMTSVSPSRTTPESMSML